MIETSAVKYNGRRPASWRAAIIIIVIVHFESLSFMGPREFYRWQIHLKLAKKIRHAMKNLHNTLFTWIFYMFPFSKYKLVLDRRTYRPTGFNAKCVLL